MLSPNVVCIWVCLKSWLRTTCGGSPPRFSSITTRIPARSDSSRRSEMPVIFFSRTRSAILVMSPPSPPFLTWNGSSETMTASLPPRSGSMWARARTRTLPRPEAYASRMPSALIIPPPGKSGPLTCCISPCRSISGFSMYACTAPITSVRLWGGMLVAIPTAIPDAPFTSRFGNRAGRTSGSCCDSS